METTAGVLIAGLILLAFLWLSRKSGRKTLPGPMGLPFVGYAPFMTSKPYLDLEKLAKKYGPVFSLRLGTEKTIVLSDFQTTRDAFAQDAFIGRPPINIFHLNRETLETQAFNGLPWKEQRRFSMHVLKDLGFAKSKTEQFITEEIQELLQHFEETKGRPTIVVDLLAPSVSNNITSLVFGRRLRYDDPIRLMLDRVLKETAPETGQVTLSVFFPRLAKVLKFFGLLTNKIDSFNDEFRGFVRKEINEHDKTVDENHIRDYIDGYMLEIRKRNDPAFCKEVLEDMVSTFFGAGSETVRLTLDWLMLAMAVHPDVQTKVQKEIDETIGQSDPPSWGDQARMPYVQAVIMEVLRWRTIVPINLLRYTLADTELNGFFIPKQTYVLANLWAVHHDPRYWGQDAEEFRPERFLSPDSNALLKSEHFIPFSIGKRACPGEFYARIQVFLYLVSIFQKFSVSLVDGQTDLDGVLGIGLSPKEHHLSVRRRHFPQRSMTCHRY